MFHARGRGTRDQKKNPKSTFQIPISALPFAWSRSCQFMDTFQEVSSQLNIGGFRVFVYPICTPGSWYGKDILPLVK